MCTQLSPTNVVEWKGKIWGRKGRDDYNDINSVVVPTSVHTIGAHAFRKCIGLTSLVIPETDMGGVQEIGDHAFSGSALRVLEVPSSVTSIGSSAFRNCSGLRSVTLLHGLTSLGESAFECCTALTSIALPSSVTNIDSSAFRYCSSLGAVALLDGLASLGHHAFECCDSLTAITLPDSLTSVGSFVFGSCSSLTSLELPGVLPPVGAGAFRSCDGLVSVKFRGPASRVFIAWAVASSRHRSNWQHTPLHRMRNVLSLITLLAFVSTRSRSNAEVKRFLGVSEADNAGQVSEVEKAEHIHFLGD